MERQNKFYFILIFFYKKVSHHVIEKNKYFEKVNHFVCKILYIFTHVLIDFWITCDLRKINILKKSNILCVRFFIYLRTFCLTFLG